MEDETMDYQKQIIDFLCKPENLPIALEVSRNMESLRRYFHKSFWEDITKALQTRLKASRFVDRWNVVFEEDFDQDYAGCLICKKNIPENFKGTYLSLHLQQDSKKAGYQLRYGLVWNKEHKVPPKVSVYKKVLQKSIDAGVPESFGNIWWSTLFDLDLYPRSDDFAILYGLSRTDFIKDLSERIWAYFESIEPELYQLNKELMRA
jgi:hypothetical protein